MSMDGPNTNLVVYRSVEAMINKKCNEKTIIDIGTCGLHVINNSFEASFKNGKDRFSVESAGRALVAEQARHVLPNMVKFVARVIEEKAEPACNSFKVVKKALKDELLDVKLAFSELLQVT
ncbi:hypothetical protein QAD02_014080 [Eretmocerus hayati]|uniref:Uncharacterized protein n=1 Tax=Eretmocerus hayati TaxID=131215 RepID=A0ACC2P4B0_9HYME|nr:hypothetical protein QAD02_014080 [Eretmocerus hayati]